MARSWTFGRKVGVGLSVIVALAVATGVERPLSANAVTVMMSSSVEAKSPTSTVTRDAPSVNRSSTEGPSNGSDARPVPPGWHGLENPTTFPRAPLGPFSTSTPWPP